MELRYVVANLVNRYEISLAPDQREDVFLNSKVDALALNPGPLMTVFKKRNHTENKRAWKGSFQPNKGIEWGGALSQSIGTMNEK